MGARVKMGALGKFELLSQKWQELGSMNQARVGADIIWNMAHLFTQPAGTPFRPSGLDDVKLDNVDDALDDVAGGHPCISQCLLVPLRTG